MFLSHRGNACLFGNIGDLLDASTMAWAMERLPIDVNISPADIANVLKHDLDNGALVLSEMFDI